MVSVSLPAATVILPPPLSLMTPPKVPLAFVSDKDCAPRATAPLPSSDAMDAPVVLLMSNVPLAMTSLELAMLPAPDSASVAPVLIVVLPV